MAEDQDLTRFAELLIRLVRDRAIETCDRLASGRMVGPHGERWRLLLAGTDPQRALEELIPDVVDETLFELLQSVDTDALPVAWRREDGSFVMLSDLGSGELAGWLMGSGGWREQHSTQRAFDPFGELRLDLGADDDEPGDESPG